MYTSSFPTLAAVLATMVQALPPRPAVRTNVLKGRRVPLDGAVEQTYDSQRANFEEKGGKGR